MLVQAGCRRLDCLFFDAPRGRMIAVVVCRPLLQCSLVFGGHPLCEDMSFYILS
jgi:hypothetical protein